MNDSAYSIERGFISKLLETKDMKHLKDAQIKASFLTGENKKVFLFIQDTFKNTGEVPTERVIKRKFPNYKLEYYNDTLGTEESLAYWCQELRQKAKHNKVADSTEKIAELLDKGESEEAYELMKQSVWYIEDEIVDSESVDITKNTEDRKDIYLERKRTKGMMGIPTGIPHLDYMLKGLIPETLTTLIARTGVGKTFFLTLVGAYAMLNGYKVVCFVTEMSTELMQDRFEAVLYGKMYGEFNYSQFKSGSLPSDVEEQYFEFLDEDLPKFVVSVIEREKPDLVLIDGAYLMEDEQGAKDDWLRVTHITRDLKKIAKKWHIPILINSQADKSTSKKTGPELNNISYAQSIGMDSDNVLALFRDEVMFEDKEMEIKVLKQREGMLGKVVINWDFTRMNFDSIYSEGESSFDEEQKEEESEEVSSLVEVE